MDGLLKKVTDGAMGVLVKEFDEILAKLVVSFEKEMSDNKFIKCIAENKYIVMSGTGYVCVVGEGELPVMSTDKKEALKMSLVESVLLIERLYEAGLEGVIRKA